MVALQNDMGIQQGMRNTLISGHRERRKEEVTSRTEIQYGVRCWSAWCRWSGERSACQGGRCLGGCPCLSGGQCAAPVDHSVHWREWPDPGRCLQSHSYCRSVIIIGQSEEDVEAKERSRLGNQKWKPKVRVNTQLQVCRAVAHLFQQELAWHMICGAVKSYSIWGYVRTIDHGRTELVNFDFIDWSVSSQVPSLVLEYPLSCTYKCFSFSNTPDLINHLITAASGAEVDVLKGGNTKMCRTKCER